MEGYYALAEIIYNASLDMDYADDEEYADMEVGALARELKKMDKSDSIVYKALERIFTE